MLGALLACAATLASAQHAQMFGGTSFPGKDLYAVSTATPEDCANRCLAEPRCKAFTWQISKRACMLKWDSSTYEGSFDAESGIIQGRSASPPPPAAPSVATGGSCSVPDAPPCAGCSVTCATGQQARCTGGSVGAGGACAVDSKCECVPR
ncbi:MAG: hypothetical protein JSR18_11815 [Proteobacteria bacterium]|nr:hypothetical protein [Pseudomonadota bacterium]